MTYDDKAELAQFRRYMIPLAMRLIRRQLYGMGQSGGEAANGGAERVPDQLQPGEAAGHVLRADGVSVHDVQGDAQRL